MGPNAPPPDHQTTEPRSQNVVLIGCQAETVVRLRGGVPRCKSCGSNDGLARFTCWVSLQVAAGAIFGAIAVISSIVARFHRKVMALEETDEEAADFTHRGGSRRGWSARDDEEEEERSHPQRRRTGEEEERGQQQSALFESATYMNSAAVSSDMFKSSDSESYQVTATQTLRIVTLGLGTARQKMVLERGTNPKLLRRT
jgi:hypothetical protein